MFLLFILSLTYAKSKKDEDPDLVILILELIFTFLELFFSPQSTDDKKVEESSSNQPVKPVYYVNNYYRLDNYYDVNNNLHADSYYYTNSYCYTVQEEESTDKKDDEDGKFTDFLNYVGVIGNAFIQKYKSTKSISNEQQSSFNNQRNRDYKAYQHRSSYSDYRNKQSSSRNNNRKQF